MPYEGAWVDEILHKGAVAADEDAAHGCLAECPGELTCDPQRGECGKPEVFPPEGGPQLH